MGLFLVLAGGQTVRDAAAGRFSAAEDALAATGVVLGMFAFGVMLVTFSGRSGIRDEQLLRAWIDKRLSDDQ